MVSCINTEKLRIKQKELELKEKVYGIKLSQQEKEIEI